jgi:heterodisulfide reductase subunit B
MVTINQRYALFLGCNVPTRAMQYEASTRKVVKRLGIELWDSDDFSCCGYPLGPLKYNGFLALAAKNLCIAERENLDIIGLCSSCTVNLTKANHILKENAGLRGEVNEILKEIDLEFKGTVKIKHITRVLKEDIGLDRIKESIKNDLSGLKVASHYGCHFIKPSDAFDGFDSAIRPKVLDELIGTTGAVPTDYYNRKQCCGGGILGINKDVSQAMVLEKLENIQEVEADCMVLHCPFCKVMYDEMQKKILRDAKKDYQIPVLFITQLIGLGMGLDPVKDLAFKKNNVSTKALIERFGVRG